MRNLKGFTLLELLIVMAIIGASSALVGPLVFEQVDKTKANAEIKQFENSLKTQAAFTYLHGQPTRVVLEGRTLVYNQGAQRQSIEFEYLFFKPQHFTINSNGYLPAITIELTALRKQISFELGSALK